MDDSGYFSVQVISQALKVYELELVPYTSTEPVALVAQEDPSYVSKSCAAIDATKNSLKLLTKKSLLFFQSTHFIWYICAID